MLTKYLAPIYTHLKWVFDFVLYYPFYMLYDSHPPINLGTELSTFHYELTSGSEEHVDCAVCLSKFGERDEVIRVMRCEHVFHKGCLDRWLVSRMPRVLFAEDQWLQKGLSLTLELRLCYFSFVLSKSVMVRHGGYAEYINGGFKAFASYISTVCRLLVFFLRYGLEIRVLVMCIKKIFCWDKIQYNNSTSEIKLVSDYR